MKTDLVLYVCDTETTGLSHIKGCEIIEISLYRLSDNVQKTWCIKPMNYEAVEAEALRINGHKLDDMKYLTKFGVETYKDPASVVVEIENFMAEDLVSSGERVLCGQNVTFDLGFIEKLWADNNATETFPFGKRPLLLDTKQIALFLDIATGEKSDFYNLASLVTKYGVKKEKAHRADSDTRVTKEVLLKQFGTVTMMHNAYLLGMARSGYYPST